MLVDHSFADRVFFCNSGTEGNEAALKFARARAGALGLKGRDLLAFHGGFHGRTGFALSTTYNPPYREPFQPLVPGVRFAPFNDLAALEAAFTDEVCGVIVEPVQGESGAVPATQEFLAAVRALATTRNAALILDEVQCGMGRSGTVLAQQQYGIRGDMTVMSKALGAGLPIGAVLMTEAVAATIAPGMHGCTFGGNAVCAAAAALFAVTARSAPHTASSPVAQAGLHADAAHAASGPSDDLAPPLAFGHRHRPHRQNGQKCCAQPGQLLDCHPSLSGRWPPPPTLSAAP